MQGADVLLTIAEVAVAFAGFASVVVLFQHRDPARWPRAVVVRLRTMIEGSLVALLSALFPFVLHHFGFPAELVWAVSSLVLALVYAVFASRVWQRSRGPIAGGELSRAFSTSVGALTLLVMAMLVANAANVVFHRGFGAYLLGVAWTLVFASLMFLRVVTFPTPSSDSD